MAPDGALELQLAQRMATDSWRLNRSSAIEENIFALGLFRHSGGIDIDDPELHAALTAARTFTREAKTIELLTLYEQRINRSLQKNLALLQQLQATRKATRQAERQAEMEQTAKPIKPNEINDLPDHPTSVSPNENGFVFSNARQRPQSPDSRRPEPSQPLTQAA